MCSAPKKLAFKHFAIGSEFASNGFVGARIQKVSATKLKYVTAGYDDEFPAPVGATFRVNPEQEFSPLNHV